MATADQGYLIESLDTQGAGADILKLRWFPRSRRFGNLILSGDLEGTFEVQISPPDEDTWGVLYTQTAASPAVVAGLESIEFAGPCDVRFEVSAYTAGSVNAWLHVKD